MSETTGWQEFIARVRSRGVLGKQLYVITTEPAGDLDAVRENMGDHLAYQESLEASGVMFAAGPFADDAEREWSGAGMVIVRAASLDEARAIADADPMHARGARRYRIRPWLLNEGSLTLRVTYSDGAREII